MGEALKYDLGEFAAKLAETFGRDRADTVSFSQSGEIKSPAGGVKGAVALPSDQREGAWEVRWPEGPKIYGYLLVPDGDDSDAIRISLLHPFFHESLKYEATMTVRYDHPMPDIVHTLRSHEFMRIPEITYKSDMIRWNANLTEFEIKMNEYRRKQLDSLWGTLSKLPVRHPLFVDEINIPLPPSEPDSLYEHIVLSYEESEYEDNFDVSFCLGYLYAFLDDAQGRGIFEEFYDVETWREMLLSDSGVEEVLATADDVVDEMSEDIDESPREPIRLPEESYMIIPGDGVARVVHWLLDDDDIDPDSITAECLDWYTTRIIAWQIAPDSPEIGGNPILASAPVANGDFVIQEPDGKFTEPGNRNNIVEADLEEWALDRARSHIRIEQAYKKRRAAG